MVAGLRALQDEENLPCPVLSCQGRAGSGYKKFTGQVGVLKFITCQPVNLSNLVLITTQTFRI